MTSQTIDTLLEQIAAHIPETEQHLLTALRSEINQLSKGPGQSETTRSTPVIDPASGCYRLANDPAFYCPHCYDRNQQRVPTQRLNRKLRVCPQCRSSLRPQR
jgi:hypothetical protein